IRTINGSVRSDGILCNGWSDADPWESTRRHPSGIDRPEDQVLLIEIYHERMPPENDNTSAEDQNAPGGPARETDTSARLDSAGLPPIPVADQLAPPTVPRSVDEPAVRRGAGQL